MNYYSKSWAFYKAHSEYFNEDFEYYKSFCENYRTLEIFAGYGRLANYLAAQKINIETVELEQQFSNYIQLPEDKKYVADILKFKTNNTYERIIAGFNSFCLFLKEEEIKQFFRQVDELLEVGGMASLSYFPITAWRDSKAEEIILNNKKYLYHATFDLTQVENNIAIWTDNYLDGYDAHVFNYPTRVYKDKNALLPFLEDTNLRLINIIENYNNPKIMDHGWIEYILIRL